MKPKQRVLKRWPEAHAFDWAGPSWIIYDGEFVNLGMNAGSPTARQAWAEAAKHATVRRIK